MMNALQISELELDDCHAIVVLLQKIYKQAYILQWMYHVELLKEAILTKRYIFLGAKLNNELVAMFTISFPNHFNTVAEVGTLCISPRFREYNNGEILRKLVSYSKEHVNNNVRKGNICTLLVKSVTKHVLTQKLQIFSNLIPSGLTYCTRPEEHELQKIITHKVISSKANDLNIKRYDQIITVFCYPSKIKYITVCLPDYYFSLIINLFSESELTIINNSHLPFSFADKSTFIIQSEALRSFVCIQAPQGCTNAEKILTQSQAFIDADYRIIHVFLNVGEYNLIMTIESLKSFGFIFCAFIPSYYDINGHLLILQYLNGCTSQVDPRLFLDPKIKYLNEYLSKEKGAFL